MPNDAHKAPVCADSAVRAAGENLMASDRSDASSRPAQTEALVLLVDDDPTGRKLFSAAMHLCTDAPGTVLFAESASQAVDSCSSDALEAVFVSMSMHGVDTRTLVTAIRKSLADAGNENCPIIGCGSKRLQADVKHCAALNMVGLLPRAAPRELGEVMNWLSRGRHQQTPYPFHNAQALGDWSFRLNRGGARPHVV